MEVTVCGETITIHGTPHRTQTKFPTFTFTLMPPMLLLVMLVAAGNWHVAIPNVHNLSVHGSGTLRIKRLVQGEWLDGIVHGVLYTP